ncbi:MAG TPA: DEAD/DEAH box helicase, partial [Terriglobales bacterium]|nr:DEAD/DEAH box helicase [Terriglobales bacterium]
MGKGKTEEPKRKRNVKVLVDPTLRIQPQIHVPQPSFGSLIEITPFKDDFFHHPPTLNPDLATARYLEAGLRLEYSPQAEKIIREHRSIVLEYDSNGFVWVRPSKEDSLREILDDTTFKTYIVWSPYYDAYRLRQAGSVDFATRAFESQGVQVQFKNFPHRQAKLLNIQAPKNINVTLYPFQRKAVEFVLLNEGRACVFDEMGLGKTITASTALVELLKAGRASRALVVAPNAVIEQWREELVGKFNLAPTVVTSKRTWRERASMYDDPLVVVNYELLRTDAELIIQKGFDTLILDEATRVKNLDTQTSEAVKKLIVRNVIALTGTPLENHLGELYNIVSIVKPGFFGRYNEDFLARFTIKSSGQGWQSRPMLNPETLPQLRAELGQISIRRTKGQVLKQLPALTMQYVYTEPARNQKMIYDILQESLSETVLDEFAFSNSEETGPNPFTSNRIRLYTLLREACADISMIAGYLRRKQRENTDDAQALRDSPIFRKLLRVVARLEPENAKLVELRELVEDLTEQSHKLVIFSQFVPIVNLIQEELSGQGIPSLVYHGQLSNDERTLTLRKFTENADYRVLASTDAGQFGLNLQAADVVVNYDLPWNPARLQQRIARLHRIGQTNKVLAVNFVVKGTIEEHVRDVLERKRKLFRDVTVSEMAESEDLTLEELRDIFGLD